MKIKWKFVIAVCMISTCMVLITTLIVRSQRQDESAFMKKIRQNNDPVAEYNPPEPNDPKERNLRRLKNAKFDLNRQENKNVNAESFKFNENSPEFFFSSSLYMRPRPAFPLTQNTVVVLGRITDAKAFLSNDKTRIYSEYLLNIEEVFKAMPGVVFDKGSAITVIRSGGKVRLPSGKILYRGSPLSPLPVNGKRYLMFLQPDQETASFGISAAYEFQSGIIVPLDGSINGEISEVYAQQYEFRGMDENSFINIVRAKISEFEGRK